MFWLGLLIGLIVGANLSLVLYAMIFTAKQSDAEIEILGRKR